MELDNRDIPYRKSSDGNIVIETRPLVIEEWLDTLPYADFQKACNKLLIAVRESNQQKMKYTQRLELATLYHQPYRYLMESQLDIRSHHTQNAILSLQSNLDLLKELSLAMAVTCRIAIDEALHHKTMWISSKPPVEAILMAMQYFSEALVCCYLQYYPTPKTIWKEINFLYDFSEGIGKHEFPANEFGVQDADKRTTISTAYKRIVLTSLVDPYHLPFGAIWEIYEAMDEWAAQTEIIDYKDIEDTSSIMVMDLKNDMRPVPYSKFNKKIAKKRAMRMLYGGSLVQMLKTKLKSISNSGVQTLSIPLATHYLEYVLRHLIVDLEEPPKRNFARQQKNIMVRVAHGFNDSYFYINDKKDFNSSPVIEQEDVNTIIEVINSDYNPEHSIDLWELQDFSQGGYSIRKELKPDSAVRVGELLAIYTGKDDKYNLGVVSWLMIRPGNMYKIGVEVMAREVKSARIRKAKSRGDFSRAFVSGDIQNGSASVITEHSVGDIGKEYELHFDDGTVTITLLEMQKETTTVNKFSFIKAA